MDGFDDHQARIMSETWMEFIEHQGAKFAIRMEHQDAKFSKRMDGMDAKFDKIDEKFNQHTDEIIATIRKDFSRMVSQKDLHR